MYFYKTDATLYFTGWSSQHHYCPPFKHLWLSTPLSWTGFQWIWQQEIQTNWVCHICSHFPSIYFMFKKWACHDYSVLHVIRFFDQIFGHILTKLKFWWICNAWLWVCLILCVIFLNMMPYTQQASFNKLENKSVCKSFAGAFT